MYTQIYMQTDRQTEAEPEIQGDGIREPETGRDRERQKETKREIKKQTQRK